MDLWGNFILRMEGMEEYLKKHYGEIPRIRAVRFMELEGPLETEQGDIEMFNKYCWQKVINIHTRCGGNNYESCGGKEWEDELKKKGLFIDGHDECFDNTYRDTYVKIKNDAEYKKFVKMIKEFYNDGNPNE